MPPGAPNSHLACVLQLSFCQPNTNLGILGKKEFSLEELLPPDWPEEAMSHLDCQLMSEGPPHCEWCHLWSDEPGLFRKGSQGKEACKQRSSLVAVLVPTFGLLPQLPSMTRWQLEAEINPVPLELLLAMVFNTARGGN